MLFEIKCTSKACVCVFSPQTTRSIPLALRERHKRAERDSDPRKGRDPALLWKAQVVKVKEAPFVSVRCKVQVKLSHFEVNIE